MKKRFLSLVTAVIMFVVLMPKTALSEDNPFAAADKKYQNTIEASLQEYTEPQRTTLFASSSKTERVIVGFPQSIALSDIYHLISKYSYSIIGSSDQRTFLIYADYDTVYADWSNIAEYIEKDSEVEAYGSVTANDYFRADQWELDMLNLNSAWEITKGSNDVIVAVIDSGISRTHEDFDYTRILAGYDYVAGKSGVDVDSIGHGTAVTGIIAAATNNNKGISGVCWNVSIMPYRTLNEEGTGSTSDIVKAIRAAADAGADVINMSLGSNIPTLSERSAVNYAVEKGCIVIAASGNDGTSLKCYPASYDKAISVASVNRDKTHSSFSQHNDSVDFCAPGSNVHVINYSNKGAYSLGSGTSFSTPYVSGLAALAKSICPSLTASEFIETLKSGAEDLGAIGKDAYYGWGIPDAKKMLDAVSALVPVESVSLNKYSAEISVGESLDLTAMVLPENASNKTISWSATGGVIVDDGKVYGIQEGLATVTATSSNGITATCSITVVAKTSAVDSGKCGANVAWKLSSEGELSVVGSGDMWDYCDALGQALLDNPFTKYADSIKTIIINKGITSVGAGAFKKLDKLESISFADTVESIDTYAFSGCTSLVDLTLPKNLHSLYNMSFGDCTALKTITIPGRVDTLMGGFEDCTAIEHATVEWDSNYSYPSFSYRSTSMCFSGCTALKDINVSDSHPVFYSIEGVVFLKKTDGLVFYPFGKTDMEYTVPENTKSIAGFAFGNNKNIKSVTIPSGVNVIDEYAFANCSNLKKINLEGNIPSTISANSFSGVTATLYYKCNKTISVGNYGGALTWEKIHTEVVDEVVEPTCNNTGLTEGKHCSICGELTQKQETVNETGHKYSDNNDATCNVCGYTRTLKVTKIIIGGSSTVNVGTSVKLTATVSPSTATNKNITWKVINGTGKARITSNGILSGERQGNVKVIVTANDGSGVCATKTITIKGYNRKITLSSTNISVLPTKTYTLKGTVSIVDSVSAPKSTKLMWKSGNTKIAKVSSTGIVKAGSPGTTTIICYAKDDSEILANCTVTVKQLVTGIKLSKTSATIAKGKTYTLKATVTPTNATNKKVTWKSSNKKIAKVSASGKITAIAKGIATITCTAADKSGKSAICKVTVK